jgi:hypothetical protein
MARNLFRPEQIINKLREAEVLISQGAAGGEASRKIGITEQTYYCRRREYGGIRIEQAKRLKELERENSRLKKLVPDLSLDNSMLKEAARGNSWASQRDEGWSASFSQSRNDGHAEYSTCN